MFDKQCKKSSRSRVENPRERGHRDVEKADVVEVVFVSTQGLLHHRLLYNVMQQAHRE